MDFESIQWVKNTLPKTDDEYLCKFTQESAAVARRFHESFPQYAPTPLASLPEQAKKLGLGGLFVKDESYRFGLNAFKVLGGSFAIANHVAEASGHDVSEVSYGFLTSDEFEREFSGTTFFTATDGNHGRGVAWTAHELGQAAVVHMPRGTTDTRRDNIAALGARVTVEDMDYDDCVRLAAAEAAECPGGVVVQDTAWEGYEKIPLWISQGYATMASEAADQLEAAGVDAPTHVFLQAGVGSMAGAVVAYLSNRYADKPPTFVVVEATRAACLYESALAGDGQPRAATGSMDTIMAGLNCGEVNIQSWDILKNHAAAFVACPDEVTKRGMRLLARPLGDDARVVSGESGAVGAGLVSELMEGDAHVDLREFLGLGPQSQVLLFSTEGNTDPARYEEIVGPLD